MLKRQASNIVRFAKENFNLDLDWGRTISLIKRVGYKHTIRAILDLQKREKLPQFIDGNHFINYIQKVATENVIKEIENTKPDKTGM